MDSGNKPQRRVDKGTNDILLSGCAGIAQLVECQLPKLNVAGSSPVARSRTKADGR